MELLLLRIIEYIVFLPLLLVLPLATMSGSDVVNLKVLQKICEGNVKFTSRVYEVVSKKDGNVFISPFSVEVVLALAYMGANGPTAQQIASALDLPAAKADIGSGFRGLLSSLQSADGNMTLEIANNVCTMTNYQILPEFSQTAEKDFLSGTQTLDFSDGEGARTVINHWVEEKTRNKIKDLIPSGLLNSMTRLVLVNAIYFKGLWVHQFDPLRTKPEKFYLNSNSHKEIPMMHKKARYGYLESKDLDSKILQMPYQGGLDLSMFVILPNQVDGIKELEKKLGKTDLTKLLHNLPNLEVVVTMPKFKLEETTDFNDILQQLGMVTMFDEKNADFSGISGEKELYVSKVLQKAFIDVNEEGSEAAAATAGVVRNKRSLMTSVEIIEFTANHPFICVVHSKKFNLSLFMGKFMVPIGQFIQHEEL